MAGLSPRATYRTYLQHLRYVPDPHVWSVVVPTFRHLLREANRALPEGGESSAAAAARQRAELQRERSVKKVHERLNELRAAVACHPHAFVRLLRTAYGQRGRAKWNIVKNITLSVPVPNERWAKHVLEGDPNPETRFPPTLGQPLPLPLVPLSRNAPVIDRLPRARNTVPPSTIRRERHREWAWPWTHLRAVPFVLAPTSKWKTGWEGRGLLESLLVLSGMDRPSPIPPPPRRSGLQPLPPRDGLVPTFYNLRPSLQRVFPKTPRFGQPPDPYPRPRVSHTRKNPKTWKPPRPLTPQLIRHIYIRFWDKLVWVRETRSGTWEKCNFDEFHRSIGGQTSSKPWSIARPDELEWIKSDV